MDIIAIDKNWNECRFSKEAWKQCKDKKSFIKVFRSEKKLEEYWRTNHPAAKKKSNTKKTVKPTVNKKHRITKRVNKMIGVTPNTIEIGGQTNTIMSEKQETDSFTPKHYHSQPFDSSLVQETIYWNVLCNESDKYSMLFSLNRLAKKAMWVSFAVKHLLRAGLKDDVNLELKKAENYLHKARTGEWLKDE